MSISACRTALAVTSIALAAAASSATAKPAELQACRVAGIRHELQCGQVRRPLDPARPDGPQIDVRYVVVPAMARRKLADPVFLLAGGPGQSAIGVAPTLLGLFNRLNNRRDIVFVDQRGTGRSAPLDCPDDRDAPLAEQSDPAAQLRQLSSCKAQLLKRPYLQRESDLGFFTTTLAMQDLEAVRQQLGAAQINLVGGSYGTRAALEYMRQFPQAVRRSVLDGVAPPDMALPASTSTDAQAALDALLAACAAEPRCTAAYPSLRDDWSALLNALPKDVSVINPRTGRREPLTLTRERVLGLVRGPLYGPALAAGLPAAIGAAAQGRYEALIGLSAWLRPRRPARLAAGMHFSVVCAEDFPRLTAARDAPGRDFGAGFARVYEEACAQWPRGVVPAAFYTVAPFPRPVLLTSGGLDPATPPRHGERVAAALGPSARHVVVPNAGHGVLGSGCMRDVLFRFIDAPTDAQALAVDADCVSAIPRPPAFAPPAVAEGAK
jgi:pimeloyl-ACP methyl ester carboxylesterase